MPYARVKNELPLIPGYASGYIASFSDAAVAPLNMLKLSVKADQAGSGDPAPDNVRPITGYSQAVIQQRDDQLHIVDTKTSSFGQTIYIANIDLLNGTGVVTHRAVDLGTLDWNKVETYFITSPISGMKSMQYNSDLSGFMCSILSPKIPSVNWTAMTNGQYGVYQTSLRAMLTDYTTAEEVKQVMSGQYLVYELATPAQITFTPMANIDTLLGYNRISADCGPIELKYIRRLDS